MAQLDKQILLTKKFKELLLEFCQPRRSKRLSDQVVAEKLLELFKEKQILQLKK
jgi:hypothetical protein